MNNKIRKATILSICSMLLIGGMFIYSNKNRLLSDNKKNEIIANYLISPDETPNEVFKFIKRAYSASDFDKVIDDWNIREYYEKVKLQ